jgi:carbon storage regulator
MLVLSRKLGEAVIIGDNIRLTVVAIRGNQVRLGIAAPVEVAIRRLELDWLADRSVGREPPTASPARNGDCTRPPAG